MLRGGFAVDAFGTAPEALDAAAAGGAPYDAVLLDINLGAGVSGEDVMRRLRDLPGYGAVPILAFTAYALPGDRERFLNAGFDGYLPKPFTKAQLLALLTEVLEGLDAGVPAEETPPEATLHLIVPGRKGRRVAVGDGASGQPAEAD
jgi:CheY-like chemotaxis protein